MLQSFGSLLKAADEKEEGGEEEGGDEGAMEAEGAGTAGAEQKRAWRDFTFACLKSFVRRYNLQVGRLYHMQASGWLVGGTIAAWLCVLA